jgi:hypothetical protein
MHLLPADGQLVNGKKPNINPLREKAGGDDDMSKDSCEDNLMPLKPLLLKTMVVIMTEMVTTVTLMVMHLKDLFSVQLMLM